MSVLPPGLFGTMARLWEATIRPVFEAADVRSAVEIGCDKGHLTKLLIAYCTEHGGRAHGIDPEPCFDTRAWEEEHGDAFHFHQGKSLDLLPTLPPVDAVFIDGDHNHYTVLGELRILEERAGRGMPFPLVILHDTGWPYARRDMYYHPEQIPAGHRRAHHRSGMIPGKSDLSDKGINAHLQNADTEGGKENGVLTAIESFLGSSTLPLRLLTLPGIHGLGILASTERLGSSPTLQTLLTELEPSPSLLRHVQAIEDDRLTLQQVVYGNTAHLSAMHGQIEDLQAQVVTNQENIANLMRNVEQLQSTIARMERSISWRWTAPLRRLGKVFQR
jgi:hypothetical protein